MRLSSTVDRYTADDLAATIARKAMVSKDMVIPFSDFTDVMTELFLLTEADAGRLIVGGMMSPDTAIAADRAQLEVKEITGMSPFAGDADAIVEQIKTGRETVYVANPNRVTGANFSLADLRLISKALTEGTLIVDEHFYDFYGITAVPLLQENGNVVIVRSLTTPFGISSDESGFVITTPTRARRIEERLDWTKISVTLHKILSTTLSNREALSMRMKSLHDESLRLANSLTKMGVQTRISATDFLLLRVADPKKFVANLTSHRIQAESLDDNAELDHYVRYRLQSPLSNDSLLKAVEKMSAETYRMDTVDRRMIRLRRPAEQTENEPFEIPATVIERNRVVRKTGKELVESK